jgi:hypothetical protein
MMSEDTLTFAVPFRAKAVSRSWSGVLERFRITLNGMLNQTDPRVRVFVVCHDAPEIPEMKDARVETIFANYPPPLYVSEYMVDKARKREIAAHRLGQLGGGLLMYSDDDDLISCRLAQWILAQPKGQSFIIDRGYEYFQKSNKIRYAPRFNRMSGTCSVLFLRPADLPTGALTRERTFAREIVETSHADWYELFKKNGRPIVEVPFPAAVWVRHDEQASAALNISGWRRNLVRKLYRLKTPTAEQCAEFGIPLPSRGNLAP